MRGYGRLTEINCRLHGLVIGLTAGALEVGTVGENTALDVTLV